MLATFLSWMITDAVDSPQLRSILPNDSVVWCENRKSPYVSIHLFLSCKGMPDTLETFGYRHLLEHIAARAIPGLDREIETAGGTFEASTTRDWMNFEWRVPPQRLDIAWKGMKALLRGFPISEADIKREATAISHELRLRTPETWSSEEGWNELFGGSGLSAAGTFESVSKASLKDLKKLWADSTEANRVVITVSGQIDLKQVSDQAKEVAMMLKSGRACSWNRRSVQGSSGFSERVTIPLPSLDTKSGIATLVATFGVAAKLSQPYAIYTPSARDSAITIGSYNSNERILDAIKNEDTASLFRLGKSYAVGWLSANQQSASASASFNGVLLTLDPSLKPHKLSESIEYTSFSEFQRVLNQIKAVAK
jgi:hypothetical protein